MEKNFIIKKGALCFYSIFGVDLWGIGIKDLDTYLAVFWQKNAEFFFHTSLPSPCSTKECNKDVSCCECFYLVDKFHSRSGNINTFYRRYIGETWFYISKKQAVHLQVFATFYPYRNLGIMHFNVNLDNFDVDTTIKLRQLFEQKGYAFTEHTEWRQNCLQEFYSDKKRGVKVASVIKKGELFYLCEKLIEDIQEKLIVYGKEISKKIVKKSSEDNAEFIIEDIKNYPPLIFNRSTLEIQAVDSIVNDARSWAVNNSCLIYGLITGDEGYVFAPEDYVENKISNGWGVRNFIYVCVCERHSVLLNFKHDSFYGKKYIKFEEKLNNEPEQKERNAYFKINSCIAGVDHGLGNCIERDMSIAYEYNYITNQEKNVKDFRVPIYNKILSFVYNTSFTRGEMDNLYKLVAEASGTSEMIELVRQGCVLQSEKWSLYNQRINNSLVFSTALISVILGQSGVISRYIAFVLIILTVIYLYAKREIDSYVRSHWQTIRVVLKKIIL